MASDELEKRVSSLEAKFYVAIAVAVVFGIGGGIGAKLLSVAKDEILALQVSIDNIKTQEQKISSQYAKAMSDIESTKKSVLSDLDQAIARLRDESKSIVARTRAEQDVQVSQFGGRITEMRDRAAASFERVEVDRINSIVEAKFQNYISKREIIPREDYTRQPREVITTPSCPRGAYISGVCR